MQCHKCKEMIKPGTYYTFENGSWGFAICGSCKHYARLNVYPNTPTIGERWEITEETFTDFLEILPPLNWTGSSFYNSEFYSGNITTRYFIENGRYFCEWAIYPPKENK